MAAKNNLIMTTDIQVTARELDFVTRFERNWEHLRDILGIMRPIKKQPGAILKSKYAEGTLESGNVGEGEEIPYSKFVVKEKEYAEMTIEKYAKAVSIEAIKDHGYENAVQMTDDEFLFQLQSDVTGRFYDYLNTGTLTATETTFQMALAMAKGLVENKFKTMHRTATGTVGFVNIMDVYEYLGAANITIQNQFGFQYIKDFMGFNTIFLLAETVLHLVAPALHCSLVCPDVHGQELSVLGKACEALCADKALVASKQGLEHGSKVRYCSRLHLEKDTMFPCLCSRKQSLSWESMMPTDCK